MDQEALAKLIAGIVAKQVAQQLQQNLNPSPTLTPTVSTPILNDGAKLERTSSGMSTGSASSAQSQWSSCSTPSNVEDEELAASNAAVTRQDKGRVSRALMNQFDSAFLAPLHSKLFKRRFKKRKNADGTRTLKKNPDINMKLFRNMVRPVLRSVIGHSYSRDPALVHRYFRAALSLVKKRRANHVQSWRLNGTHLPLIYGGGDVFNPCRKNLTTEFDPSAAGGAVATASESDQVTHESQMMVDFEEADMCVQCGKKVDVDSAVTAGRCQLCWQIHVNKHVIPLEQERLDRQKKKGATATPKDNPDQPAAKRTRIRSNSCKCGSTTHKTVRSRQCPRNPRYIKPKKVTPKLAVDKELIPSNQCDDNSSDKVVDASIDKVVDGYFEEDNGSGSDTQEDNTLITLPQPKPVEGKSSNPPPKKNKSITLLHALGATVDARWTNGRMYGAQITAHGPKGTYDVSYACSPFVIHSLACL